MSYITKKTWTLAVAGLIIGASIGYYYRPFTIFSGQLPFDVVITRGATLKGLDQMYSEAAKTSFNYLLLGGIAGAILGVYTSIRIEYYNSRKSK